MKMLKIWWPDLLDMQKFDFTEQKKKKKKEGSTQTFCGFPSDVTKKKGF